MRRLLVVFTLLALVGTACGSAGPPTTSVCTAPTDEALDPSSGLHVLRPDEVVFDDLTPTSGPHLPAGGPLGLREPLPPAQQVAVLERGSVLLSVDSTESALLDNAVAGFAADAVIHPVEGLGDPLVVTAWRSRIVCSTMDADYVRWFVDNRTGQFAAEPHQQ